MCQVGSVFASWMEPEFDDVQDRSDPPLSTEIVEDKYTAVQELREAK